MNLKSDAMNHVIIINLNHFFFCIQLIVISYVILLMYLINSSLF